MDKELVSRVIKEINSNDDFVIRNYYQSCFRVCEQLEKYFEKYNVVNPIDKIFLAQYWGRFDISKYEFNNVEMDDYQKSTLKKITNVNEIWYETLNPKILSKKYAFLEEKIEFISTDIRTQELLLSLNDDELNLFKKLYLKLESETSNVIPYMCRILESVGETITASTMSIVSYNRGEMFKKKTSQFKTLSSDLVDCDLSSDILDKIIYVFTNNNIDFDISTLDELQNMDNKLLQYVSDSIKKYQEPNCEKNIDDLKSLILLRCYGIEFDYAKSILNRYDLSGIKIENGCQSYLSIYESIVHIVNEKNIDKLLEIYNVIDKNSDFKLNYMETALLEDGLRNIFLRQLNEETFRCNQKFRVDDGVKIYDAGDEFKIVLTSVGAYQLEFKENINYYEYWNNKSIQSHGNCCSLVANNNLSTASIKNVCFGFTDFPEGSLLLSGPYDLNSTPTSKKINIQDYFSKLMSIDNLINNTRSDYNELVFERRNLSKNKIEFKKNPDYIVFFEEFENVDYNEIDEETKLLIEKQKNIYENSKQAAKDFNIPLVVINREKCAKNELTKINEMVSEYADTKSPALINKIITEIENNRVGLRNPHHYLRDMYFSAEIIEKIVKKIISVTNNIENEELKNINLDTLKNVINLEIIKYKNVEDKQNFGQKSGLTDLNLDELIGQNNITNYGGINL